MMKNKSKVDLGGLFETNEQARKWVLTHFDETALDPMLSRTQLFEFIKERGNLGFEHICIPSTYVEYASDTIKAFEFKMDIATVIGFPIGNESSTEIKKMQIKEAAKNGAKEVDFVIDLSLFVSDPPAFWAQVIELSDAAHKKGMKIKAIFEAYHLSNSAIKEIAQGCGTVGVDMVKTSTGFALKGKNHPDRDPERTGATEAEIKAMGDGVRNPKNIGVKPAGGIRTFEQLISMLKACAAAGWSIDDDSIRIGSSSGLAIIKELE